MLSEEGRLARLVAAVRTSRAGVVDLAVVFFLAAPVALAQELLPVGTEFRVHPPTGLKELPGDVDVASNGSFIVTWATDYQSGAGSYRVFAQRFDSNGALVGGELMVSSFTRGDFDPKVAIAADGGFVVVWIDYAEGGGDYGIRGRRFDAAGVPQAAEFQVDSYLSGNQGFPDLAIDSDGDFVVVWASADQDGAAYGIFAQRFDSSGSKLGAELNVNSHTLGFQLSPAVAMSEDGGFVVVWESRSEEGPYGRWGVVGRRFDADGAPQGAAMQINVYTVNDQELPTIATTLDGGFVVAWQSDEGVDPMNPLVPMDVFARRLDSFGVPQGDSFQVNDYSTANQRSPAVTILGGRGEFVVVWTSEGQDGSVYGVFAKRFAVAGKAHGLEFQVNAHTGGEQFSPAVAANGRGDLVTVWWSIDGADEGDVLAQRYRMPALFDVDGNGESDALTDGILILRFLFGFNGGVLTTGAVDLAHCTRCDVAAIEAYLESGL